MVNVVDSALGAMDRQDSRMVGAELEADVVVVGAGLAGLVATAELADRERVVLVDQEGEQSLGGQAFWSFGGLFLVDSPEQRRMGIKDSLELATQDWMGSARFDRDEDFWPRKWAEAYLHFAAGEKRRGCTSRATGSSPSSAGPSAATAAPTATATPCRASTSPGAPARARRAVRATGPGAVASGRVPSPSATASTSSSTGGTVTGVRGRVLAPDGVDRGGRAAARRSATSRSRPRPSS